MSREETERGERELPREGEIVVFRWGQTLRTPSPFKKKHLM